MAQVGMYALYTIIIMYIRSYNSHLTQVEHAQVDRLTYEVKLMYDTWKVGSFLNYH